MACPTLYRWTSACRSHAGLVRERNEDACLIDPERGLWAVADGMGGHANGHFASRLVVDALADTPAPGSLEDFIAHVETRLQVVNRQLRDEAARRHVQRMGSTVAVLLAHEGRCACLWAGDSRIYLFRNLRLRQLTRDHSQVEEIRARGEISSELLARTGRNVITRAVGAVDTLRLDEEIVEIEDGDVFLLCSDGLSNAVSMEAIASALVPGHCEQACETLVDMALQAGGRDNITAVVVRAEDLFSSDKTLLNPAL